MQVESGEWFILPISDWRLFCSAAEWLVLLLISPPARFSFGNWKSAIHSLTPNT
jgi:hypothetical protein